MEQDVNELLARLQQMHGETIEITDVGDRHRLYERVAGANVVFPNLVGVNKDTLDWCPNNSPPSPDECLAWLWVQHPKLIDKLISTARDAFFIERLEHYRQKRKT